MPQVKVKSSTEINQIIKDFNLTGKGYAEDYYLDAKSQCAGGRGACPDKNIK